MGATLTPGDRALLGLDVPRLLRLQVAALGPLRVAGDNGQKVPISAAGSQFVPPVGSWLWAIQQGNTVLAVAPDSAPPGQVGTVGTVTAGQPIPVTVDGVAWSLAYLAAYTPTAGDRVLISWSQDRASGAWTGVVLGKVQTSAPAATQPSSPVTAGGSAGAGGGRVRVAAVASGATYDGWWYPDGPEPMQGRWGTGQAANGWWFYGAGAFQAGAGRRASSARIILVRSNVRGWFPGGAPITAHLTLHNAPTKPGSAPAILARADVPGVTDGKGTYPLPAGWAERLADPADAAAGIGVAWDSTNDYAGFAGIGGSWSDPESGLVAWESE